MLRTRPRLALRVATLLLLGAMPARAQVPHHYRVTARIPLGGAGTWDLLTVDSASRRLFIARDDRVMVVGLPAGDSVGTIPGVRGAQHVAIAGGSGHGFATSADEGAVVMFDATTLKVLARIAAAPDADVLVYDRVSDRVFSFNGDARSITVIEPRSGAKIKTIGLSGSPEFGVADGAGHIVFNIASRGEVAVLDTRALKVTRHWSIAPCRAPSGLALDAARHRVFSVCHNRHMAISDAARGRLLTTVPIGAQPDGVVFDAKARDALSANGDGTITVVHEDSPSSFRVTQRLTTMRGARTIALDPATHRAYTVATGKDGVFTLLVVER